VNLSKKAEELGADGLLLVTPYYNKASQEGLYRHYKAIADAVTLPIILYNVPSRTGTSIALDTVKRLSEIENIVAIKEASGDISRVAKIRELCGDDITIYSGNDDQIVPIMSLGGKGVISVLSNIAPKETHDIVAKFLAGDTKGALDMQLKYLPLIEALFCEVNPIPAKKAMELMGYCGGTLRLPLTEMEAANVERLKAEMKAVGLL
jgi:4-hydroxy-tetrahydrodipicolinate synthase